MLKNPFSMLLCLAAMASLVGCGGGSSGGATPPPPPSVTIAFQPPPPASLSIIDSATFSATVSDDSRDLGVDWVLSCSLYVAGSDPTVCGTLSIGTTLDRTLHTASGAMITYRPPARFPANRVPVYIAAFSTADSTKNVLATMAVTGFAGRLKGAYVFEVSGTATDPSTGNPLPYGLAGVLLADGNGTITGGEQTCTRSLGTFTDPILSTGSSYTISPDGRGILTLNTGDPNVGDPSNPGVETFSIALLATSSSPQALIGEFAPNSSSSSVGTLELQTNVTLPLGGYAFTVGGMTAVVDQNTALPDPLVFGGVFNIDSPGVISGAGSVADEEVGISNSDGTSSGVIVNSAPLSGTVSTPDELGAVTINLTSTFAPAIEFTGYIVDGTHVKLVESDNHAGAGFGITSGVAVGQGPATGSFKGNSAFSGASVYGVFGQPTGFPFWGFFSLAGMFSADGAGNLINGFTDETNVIAGSPIGDTLTGIYTVDNSGTGRVTATTNFGSSGPGPTLIFYLTGNGNAPLILNTDASTLGAGTAYPQQAVSFSFNGPYSMDAALSVNNDFTGSFLADATQNTLSGRIYQSNGSSLPFSGSFTAGSSTDVRLTGTLNGSPEAFYVIDANRGLFAETDGAQAGLGYFAVRTPVCPTCDALPANAAVSESPRKFAINDHPHIKETINRLKTKQNRDKH